jgi:hypothetical protein
MATDQIAQAKTDLDVALRLIEVGHLEPARELLRFASAELDDALSILQVGEPDHRPAVSEPAYPINAARQPTLPQPDQLPPVVLRAYAEIIRKMAQTARTKEVVPNLLKLSARFDTLAEQREAA